MAPSVDIPDPAPLEGSDEDKLGLDLEAAARRRAYRRNRRRGQESLQDPATQTETDLDI